MSINPKTPKFQDIDQFVSDGSYSINVSWSFLEKTMEQYLLDGLDVNPDFQRGHVWTNEQRTAYVEFILKGGISSRTILLNCPGWHRGHVGNFVLVDGKQRLDSVLKFLRNKLPAFGYCYNQFVDKLRMTGPDFVFKINDLPTRADVLKWYIQLNTGGVVHTNEEIIKVKLLLEKELGDI